MVIGGIIGVFLVLDLADMRSTTAWPLGLNSENAPNVAFSALLLVAAGSLALVQGLNSQRRAIPLAMASVFFFMGYDEAFEFHEEIESRLGADWQLLYLPVALAFGVAWLMMLIRGLPTRDERTLWILGAGAWLAAQALEWAQWDGDELVHPWMIAPEETLEMLGTTLWLLALLIAARAFAAHNRSAPASGRTGD